MGDISENKWKILQFHKRPLEARRCFSVLCIRCSRNGKTLFAFCIPDSLTFKRTQVSREPVRFIFRPDLWFMVNGEDDFSCRIRENLSGISLRAVPCVFPSRLRCC